MSSFAVQFLLARSGSVVMCSNASCLGEQWCSEWNCCDTPGPSAPKRRKSQDTSERTSMRKGRFKAPQSPTTMVKTCQGYVPKNTAKCNGWALCVFKSWRDERNKSVKEQCPDDLLESPVVDRLNYWLSRFVVEVRHEDGQPYPPAAINNLLAGLYHFSKSCSPTGAQCPNFMSRKDPVFRELTGAVLVRYKELRTDSVGAVVKHAPIVTSEEESMLWDSKVLGVHTPLTLVRAVFLCWQGLLHKRRPRTAPA